MTDRNPELTMADLDQWEKGWTSTMIKACIMSTIFIICLVLLFTLGSFKEITENFQKYRCNPIIMPFASNFGYDTKDNFNFCLTSIFNGKAAEIFQPIYNLLGGFTDIIKLVVDVALGIRKLFSNFLLGVNSFVRNARDRIQGLFFSIRMSFLKLNNLMGRVYGTMYAVIWMGTSAMTAGFNLGENDLVKFLFEFCFDPNTPIQLADGRFVPISKLKIGDRLIPHEHNPNPVVKSIFHFDGSNTPMVKIRDVTLSSEHYAKTMFGKWVQAKSHIESFPTHKLPELVCLNVSGHTFQAGINKLIVADYDEHTSPDIVRSTQTLAINTLNGRLQDTDYVEDYCIGIGSSFLIRMANNTWKPISEVKIGETVWNSGRVLGIVEERCDSIVRIDGSVFSSAQIVFDPSTKQWVRASVLWPCYTVNETHILHSLITEYCSTLHISASNDNEFYIRDYREVPLAEMEDAYEDAFL